MGYRWHTGSVAWILHRLSGVALTFYLVLHIWVIHHIGQGPEAFNAIMAKVQTPLFKFLELGLLGTVLYHSFNGFRILLFDFGIGIRQQKQIFWGTVVVGLLVFAVSGYGMLSHILH
ncbi:MAG: succinate dehydrogenase, cytochrome b556 subunit [Deltaproteobacteria bacterium]|nr:MAG: succinate dehydrogenase, cytochrome b556 subunit [Deltaproteobacteria bacterium]